MNPFVLLRSLWRRLVPRQNDDVAEELRDHIAFYQEDLMRQGLSADEAARRARRELGQPGTQGEQYRESIGLRPFDELGGDIRYGLCALRRNPGFAAVAVLSLALGIGATTAMFSLLYAALLHPFPYADADRIMNPAVIDEQHPDHPFWFFVNAEQFDELRRAAPVDSVLGFNGDHMEITSGALPEAIFGVYFTENAGTFFGVRPLLGRNLQPSDAEGGGRSVVVLNSRFWQRYFGSDPHVIGRILEINHTPYTIVGVMPRGFAFNNSNGVGDVYLPGSLMRAIANGPNVNYIPWIKLRPHVTLAAANAALEPVVRQFAKEHPERFANRWHLALEPIIVPYQQSIGRTLYLLLGGVLLLLLIGCVNCSILLLACGRARQQELAIRSAIGASRWRIVRQLLVEAVVISCSGAVLGRRCVVLACKASLVAFSGFLSSRGCHPHQPPHPRVFRSACAALRHPLRPCSSIALLASRFGACPSRQAAWRCRCSRKAPLERTHRGPGHPYPVALGHSGYRHS